MYIRTLVSAALLACGIGSALYAQSDPSPSGKDQNPPKSPAATTTDDNDAENQKGGSSNEQRESARREDGDHSSRSDSDDNDSSTANRDRDDNDSGDAHYRADGSRRSNTATDDDANYSRPRPSDADRSDNRGNVNNRRDRDQQSSTWNRNRDRDDRDADQRDRDERRTDDGRRFSIDRDRNFRDDGRGSHERHGVQFSTTRNGLIIADVDGNSLARRVGLRSGDEVVSVNGNRVDTASNFNRYLVARAGQRVPIVVWRNGQERTIYWADNNQSGQREGTFAQDQSDDREYSDDDHQQQSGAFLGVDFDTRYTDAVVVRRVHPNSPAQRSGVRAGDTILSINGESVASGDDVSEMVSEMSPGDEIDLQVSHAPPRTLQVRLSTRQAQQGFAGYRGEMREEETSIYESDDNERGPVDRIRNRPGLFGRD